MNRASRSKSFLLQHVRICRVDDCLICRKLRVRVWCVQHKIHCRLLDMTIYGYAWTFGEYESSFDKTMLLRESRIWQQIQLPSPFQRRSSSQNGIEWALGGETVTAVTLAQRRLNRGLAPAGSIASLVLLAKQPWSPATHALFSDAQRQSAVDLFMIGYRLSHTFIGQEEGMLDCWCTFIMPQAIGLHP